MKHMPGANSSIRLLKVWIDGVGERKVLILLTPGCNLQYCHWKKEKATKICFPGVVEERDRKRGERG